MSAPDESDEKRQEAAIDPFESPPSARSQQRAAVVRWVLIAGFAVLAAAGIAIGLGLSTKGEPDAGHGDAARARFYCPMHPQITSDEPGTCPICGMDLVTIPPGGAPRFDGAAKLFCPAHPEIRSDIPGRCPLDGDPLVPMTVDGRTEIAVDPTRVREIGVVSAVVERRSVSAAIVAPAQVALDERRVAVVDTRLPGWLSKLRVRTTGARVRRGQALATLTSTDLYEAESQLVAARLTSTALGASGGAAGGTLVAQARARLSALGVPAGEVARVASGGAAATQLVLRAPRDGTVIVVGVEEGAFVSPGTTILTIADLSHVWVIADLAEQDAPLVHLGDEVHVASTAAPDDWVPGQVELLEPVVDPRTRTRRARIVLTRPATEATTLVPGATATVRFASLARSALVVPRDAVLTSSIESHVFVDLGDGRFSPRPVRIGGTRDGMVEVLEGLGEGERVASAAAFMIDAESQLRATASASSTPLRGGP